MRTLRLADSLSLPLDVVTQTIAILAKRRAGKSYAARRLVEQLLTAGQQVVIVDPKGDWYGVRSSADGRAPGFPVVILGGERADVPLEAGAGEVVAKLVVEERVSVLLDLSLFRKHEVATFMTGFLENLYRLKARETYRTPMMLVIDEADAVAPQKPQKGEERMLGAAEDIVRRGGQRGIGCVLVTQRSAVLNKNVLTQAQVLVVLRTIAPQDIAAMNAWVDLHGTEEQRRTLMESLPSLPVGDAWFWSPGWPTADGIFRRVHILPIETFDSGATPKPGEKRVEPKNLADVDLEALTRQMASTIERKKAEDPRELRKQIAELKKALAAKSSIAPTKEKTATKVVERPVLKDGQLARAERILAQVEKAAERFSELEEDFRVTAKEIRDAIALTRQPEKPAAPHIARPPSRPQPAQESTRPPRPARPAPLVASGSGDRLPPGEKATLTAAAQYDQGVTREQLSILTGYKRSSRDAYVQRLREKGFVVLNGNGRVHATQAGVDALGDFEPLPTGEDLQAYWRQRLPPGELAVFEAALGAYPDAIAREAIDAATGYKRSSRDAYIQRLRARQLVTIEWRGLRAAEELFS